MFLRKAFLVFPSLVWAVSDVETDGSTRASGFLTLENNSVSPVKTETDPEAVVIDAVLLGGDSVGKFEVSTTGELRKKIAAAMKVHPFYVDLSSGDVQLEENASIPEIVKQEHVQVFRKSTPKEELSWIIEDVKAWEHLEDETAEKARFWNHVMPALTSLFDKSDKFSSSSDKEKCGITRTAKTGPLEPIPLHRRGGFYEPGTTERVTNTTTDASTPDCLKFRLGTFEAIWNAGRELSRVKHSPVIGRFKTSYGSGAFEDFIDDVISADLSDVVMRTIVTTTESPGNKRTIRREVSVRKPGVYQLEMDIVTGDQTEWNLLAYVKYRELGHYAQKSSKTKLGHYVHHAMGPQP